MIMIISHEINLLYHLKKDGFFGEDICESYLRVVTGLSPNDIHQLIENMEAAQYVHFESVSGCGGGRFTLLPHGERLLNVSEGIILFCKSRMRMCCGVAHTGAYEIDICLRSGGEDTPLNEMLCYKVFSEGGIVRELIEDGADRGPISLVSPEEVAKSLGELLS